MPRLTKSVVYCLFENKTNQFQTTEVTSKYYNVAQFTKIKLYVIASQVGLIWMQNDHIVPAEQRSSVVPVLLETEPDPTGVAILENLWSALQLENHT